MKTEKLSYIKNRTEHINMNSIPAEIREQLKLGLYIDGEENLYNFLQAYSS